jgi:3-phosphoshikimate 1-carboxyvinyltransferase
LTILCDLEPVSEGYLEMSLDVARRFGMAVLPTRETDHTRLEISAGQRLRPGSSTAEADVSSAFAVAAIAAVAGSAFIENFPALSLQPDHRFVEILRRMGVPIELSARGLHVAKADRLLPIEVELGGSPDLFPVLAVLCGLADGRSLLYGAPQLRGKESDRVATTAALLSRLGRRNQPRDDGIEIWGAPLTEAERSRSLHFDATGDHRLVMAGAVARWAGFPLSIRGLESVRKSFPELVTIAGLTESRA